MTVDALRDEDSLLLRFRWLSGETTNDPGQELGDEPRAGGVLNNLRGGSLVSLSVRYSIPFVIHDELCEGLVYC